MEPDSLSEAYQRLRLAHDLAVAISAASSVDEAFAATLRLLSEAGDWVVAQVWLPDPSGKQLICGPVWYQRQPGFEPFRAASLALHFRPGEPLLGSVWQQGEAKWAEDIDVNVAAFRRTDAAAESGLSAALAVPVCSNRGVIAVLEFLTQSQAPRRSGLRDLIDTAAAQLSSLMEQKLAETLLRRSEERFRAVADTASDSIVSIDATGTITYVNIEGARFFGYAGDNLIGAPVTEIIPERFHGAHRSGLARYLATGEGRLIGKTALVNGRRRDGSEIPVELSLATWQADGSPYFTAIIRDVSERQRMQDELERALAVEREAIARLSELDRLKNTLLDAVSHDLRGPLAAIRAATTVLQRDAEKPGLTSEQRRGYLTRLMASADKMRRLLDDLLDLDRLSARDVSLQRQPTDVGQIARRLVEEHRDALGERAIDLNLESVIAEVDAAAVERIIENLLLNACRHTRDGTALGISALRRDDDVVVICIDDSGPGVPEALHGVIFERFKQAPGSSTTGLGMGLSLVARLAQLHGGRAWVENRPLGGASFRVALPLKAEQGRLP